MKIAVAVPLVLLGCASLPGLAVADESRDQDRRGEALMRDGRYDEADAAFARALALEPNNGRARLLRAESLRRKAGDDTEERAVVEFAGVPLEQQDLSNLDLARLEIVDAHAPRSNWSGVRLTDVAFARAQLNEADLSGARIHDSVLDGAILDGANLSGASLEGSSLVRARAPGLKAKGASFANVRAVSADFGGSDFTQATFPDADLRAARFGAAILTGASFPNSDLRGADLSRADLGAVSLAGARADCNTRFPADFNPDSHLIVPLDLCGGRYSLDYTAKQLAGVSFQELDVRGGIFTQADLAGANFRDAELDGADFSGATGFDENFAPASAREASFENATGALTALADADLRNARLSSRERGGLTLMVNRAGPRLDGASLQRVRIVLSPGGETQDATTGSNSLLRAKIEDSVLDCAPAEAATEEARAAWLRMVQLARQLAQVSPGLTLGESCDKSP